MLVKIVNVIALVAMGLVAGAAVCATVIIAGAGVFWLYVFGDDPWPGAAETALALVAYAAGAVTAVAVPVSVARSRRRPSPT